jgi:hypothetical protein
MEVVRHLEAHGVPCWLSSRDIPPGSDWAETIYNAIAVSPAMVLLFTGNSNDSWQVRNELDIATNLKVPIIPVRLDDAEVGKGLRYFTNSHQWLDRNTSRERMLEGILTAVRRVRAAGTEAVGSPPVDAGRSRRLRFAILVSLMATVPAALFLLHGTGNGQENDLLNLVVGGTDSWDYATDIESMADSGFLAAGTWDWGFWSEVWVARFDPSGGLLWSWSDSLSGECTPMIRFVPGGDVIASYGVYSDFEHTGYWVSAVRLDSLGGTVWRNTLRIEWLAAAQPELESMMEDGDGILQLAFTLRTRSTRLLHAVHLIALDPADGSMTWDTIPGGKEACAYLPIPSGGAYNVFQDASSGATGITRYAPDGTFIRSIILGDQRTQAGCAALTAEDELVICSTADSYGAGNGDLLVASFSPDLELLWQESFGGDLSDGASEVLPLPDGNLLIAGSTMSYGDGSPDGWVLLLDDEGKLLRQTVIDLGGSDRLYAIATRPGGGYIAAGSTSRFGEPDAWIVGISQDGSVGDSVQLGLDLLTEDWENGYLDQTIWSMCPSRNYTPSFLRDSAGGGTALDLNCVPLISMRAFPAMTGLCLSALVLVEDLPSASGSNFVSIGLTAADAATFRRDPASAPRAELRWTYTEGISGQLRTVDASTSLQDSAFSRMAADSAWISPGIPQEMLLEICPASLRFWLAGELYGEATLEVGEIDSLRVFLNGSSDSAPHRLDDVRVWRRRW